MKILKTLLLLSTIASAQRSAWVDLRPTDNRINVKRFVALNAYIDPSASIQQKSPNLVFEIECVEQNMYIKANTQIFTALVGGYIDATGGLGYNFYLTKKKDVRTFAGVRLGIVFRGYKNKDLYKYPLAGLEAGIQKEVSSKVHVTLRGTFDNRQDGTYTEGIEHNVFSGFIGIGYKID